MATVWGGVRPRPQPRRHAGEDAARPSIREVCLVGLKARALGSSAPGRAGRGAGTWSAGGCVEWSGRTYRVEATQLGTDGGDEPFRYVHLSPLVEG
jgi:hypothetical protein